MLPAKTDFDELASAQKIDWLYRHAEVAEMAMKVLASQVEELRQQLRRVEDYASG
jgi:polyhydroxyalkanoate synthesis regulator phasin